MKHSNDSSDAHSPPASRAVRDSAPERRQRLIHQTVEHLRDHAVFEVPDPQSDGQAATPLAPHEREREWELENLRLLKHRILLVTAVSMASLPFFWLVFSCFAPDAMLHIGITHIADVFVLRRSQFGGAARS